MGVVGILRRSFVRRILYILLGCAFNVNGSQFSGGLITFKPTGNGADLLIEYRLSWNRSIYFCNDTTISNNGLIGETGNITCFKGCEMDQPSQVNCTNYSVTDDWSYGRNSFIYTPPSTNSPFSFGYTGSAWITLVEGGGNWSLKTTADVSVRPDTKRINSSPTLEISPAVPLQQGCSHIIKLPIIDPDGDIVRCRFANGTDECAGVCNGFPNATMDKNTCSISYNATDAVGWYAVAIQIEDFQTSSSTTPLSSVSVQFLVKVFNSTSSCDSGPEFVYPTPPEDTCFPLRANQPFTFKVTASTSILGRTVSTVNTIQNGPIVVSTESTTNLTGSYMSLDVNWTPTEANKGRTSVCFTAVDSLGSRSEQRCVYLVVEAKPVLLKTIKTVNGSTIEWKLHYDTKISRPEVTDNPRHIKVYYYNGTLYEQIDVSSPDVVYMAYSVTFSLTVDRTLSYYILIDQGIVLGGCNQPSDPINDVRRVAMKAKGIVLGGCNQPSDPINDVRRVTMKAKDGNFLLILDYGVSKIYKMDMTSKDYVEVPIIKRLMVYSLDYDILSRRILWTVYDLGEIRSVSIDGNDERLVRSTGTGSRPWGLAFDPMSRTIFYTDYNLHHVASLPYDGSSLTVIINSTIRNPTGITVDIKQRIVYWSNSLSGSIESANYDGSNRRTIVSTAGAIGITIDIEVLSCNTAGKIYWTNYNSIEACNIDGTSRQVLSQDNSATFHSLRLFEGTLFIADTNARGIRTIPASGGELSNYGPKNFHSPISIYIYKKTLPDCENPPGLPHGNWAATSTLSGGVANFTCDTGYNITAGDETWTCDEDGKWTGSQPLCTLIDCGPLPTISNGSVTMNETTFDENATYKCDPGFNISETGDSERVCTSNGTWSGQSPYCIIKDCRNIPDLQHGNSTVTTTVYGGIANFTCDTGYNMTAGDETRTCDEDGQWTGSQPVCTIVDCGELSPIANGKVLATGTTYGETANYSCNTGFDMVGDVLRLCTDQGVWNRQQPECIVKDCGTLLRIDNGTLTMTGTTFNETVTYECDAGFDISNVTLTIRECGPDGNWSKEEPSCIIKDCFFPPQINHGTFNVNGTTYGETVKYNCDKGYFTREGNMERKCDATGKWIGRTPICAEKFSIGQSCFSDLLDVDQCQGMDATCRFDSSVGNFRCMCTVGHVPYEKGNTCLNSTDYGEKCNISKQCNTFLSKCAVGPSGEGTCICKSGLTFNETSNECVSKAIIYCEKNADKRGMMWEKTEIRTTLYNECPQGYTGWISRTCKENGIFSLAFYNCTKEIFKDIASQLEKENLTTSEALETIKDAVSDFEKNDTELFPGDVDAIEDSLAQISDREPDPSATAEELTQDADAFLHIADVLTDPDTSGNVWEEKIEETNKGAERFIETVDKYSEKLATSIMSTNQTQITIMKNNLVVTVSKIPDDTDHVLEYPDKDQELNWKTNQTSSFTLDSAALPDAGDKITNVVVTVYRDISKALPTTNAQTRTQTEDRKINSQVLSIQLLPKPPQTIDPPLQLTFKKDEHGRGFETHCSFWKSGDGGNRGGWSTSGCVKTMSSPTMVKCSCNHLTNFAILISPVEAPSDHADALSAITLTGCGISIVCLIITILLHVAYWSYLKGDRNILAMTVCVSLLVAYFLFVFGINRTSVKSLCTTIAVSLHYTYLLVFFLMLSEGIYMALHVVFLFHKKSHLRELLFGSFVLPAVIVLIVASATKLQGYGNEKYCWLTVNSVAFWMFAGPAVIVILFNLSVIVIIMKKMYGTKWIQDMKQKEKAKTLAGKMLVLLPVMGVTWVFGIIAIDENSVSLQYLFVIFNSFQGVFIFVFHCVLNKQFRAAIEKSRRKLASITDESSKLHSRTDHSKSGHTTHTNVDPQSTVTNDAEKENKDTDHVTRHEAHNMAPINDERILKDPPPIASEEEKMQFKKRHAIPSQAVPGEEKPKRPPTQVFIDLQFELRGRLGNMVSAVTKRASKVFTSTKQTTVAFTTFTRIASKNNFKKSEDQIHIMAGVENEHIAEGTVTEKENSDVGSEDLVLTSQTHGATDNDSKEHGNYAVKFCTTSQIVEVGVLKVDDCAGNAAKRETEITETIVRNVSGDGAGEITRTQYRSSRSSAKVILNGGTEVNNIEPVSEPSTLKRANENSSQEKRSRSEISDEMIMSSEASNVPEPIQTSTNSAKVMGPSDRSSGTLPLDLSSSTLNEACGADAVLVSSSTQLNVEVVDTGPADVNVVYETDGACGNSDSPEQQ